MLTAHHLDRHINSKRDADTLLTRDLHDSTEPIQVSRPWWKRLGDEPDRMVMWFCIGVLVVVAAGYAAGELMEAFK